MFRIDALTRQAISHTRHCLIGCGIGEVLGSAIGASLQWPNLGQTALAIVLAFMFGYGLTFWGGRRMGMASGGAARVALQTDTISITSMEIIDNSFIWLIPSAMNATVATWLFWWSMALSLAIAFVVTVPVNRFMLGRFGGGHSHHH